MKTIYFLILFGLLFSYCRGEVIEKEDTSCPAYYIGHPDNSRYRKLLNKYKKTSSAPGSVLGIKKANQAAWVGAYGSSNLSQMTPFTTCTPFRTGSITKVFTAVVVMKMIERGAFMLNTSLQEVLPAVSNHIPDAGTITIRQLLNHSSGLGHPTDDDTEYRNSIISDPETIGNLDAAARLEKFIYEKPLKHSPGSDSYYSNAGYWVLSLVVEKMTGKSMQENMQELIFSPLGMEHTYLEKRDDKNVSRGYNFFDQKLVDVAQWDRADSDGDPAAGIISTAADLLKFTEALFTGQLVSGQSLDEMKMISRFPSCGTGCGFGLGIESWDTRKHIGYGKNGSSVGVDANMIYFPEKHTAIVLFSNYGGGNRKSILDKLP